MPPFNLIPTRLAAGLLLIAAIASCDHPPTPATTATAVGSAPANSAQPRRIVTIAPNAAEMIASLGMGDHIVGVSDFCVYPESLTTLPRVGGIMNPDLERIVSLNPDLIVLRGRFPSVEALCERTGIDVFHDQTESFDDIFDGILRLGARLHCDDRAEALVARLRADIDGMQRKLHGLPRPRILLIVNREADAIRNIVTFGRGTFVDEVIRRAGGINVFGDVPVAYPQVTIEQIIAARPDVIIEAVEESRMSGSLRDKFLAQWSQLPALPAVRTRRIHVVTEDHLLIPSPRVVESIRLLARILHPEVMDG